jgi:hypothetical protein
VHVTSYNRFYKLFPYALTINRIFQDYNWNPVNYAYQREMIAGNLCPVSWTAAGGQWLPANYTPGTYITPQLDQ